MQININRSKGIDRIHASFAVFSFIPFIKKEDVRHAETAVEHWPLVGWTTGAAQALVFLLASHWLPWLVVIALALCVRLLLLPKPRIFDSRTMNVMSVALYELLLSALWLRLDTLTAAFVVFAAGPYAHMVTAQLVAMLSYREEAETNGWHIAFRKYSTAAGLWLFAQGMTPLLIAFFFGGIDWQWVVFAPCLAMYFSYLFIIRTFRGYTIDAMIAVSALLEAVVYLVL